ncbi:RNA polymerase sigma factor [Oricola sp.]|uniref:RNA polymerase sigma factor n=1 Tax=Oricola sp. TaxID=1979950 RepID=UPI0025CF6DFD|nr:RNA polymerase sigma factor [Oricola sp.]
MAASAAHAGDGDQQLAARASAGDRHAFARLMERHYDTIHRIAWRWCGNATDADDVAQDVAIKLARTISGWRAEASFTTWLYRIVLNTVRDRQRAFASERRRVEAFAVQAMVEAQGGEGADGDDPAMRLWSAVGSLPERQRDAVMLVHGEGLSHDEAAGVMGVSEGTVSFHIHEAKKKLRVLMKTPEDELS